MCTFVLCHEDCQRMLQTHLWALLEQLFGKKCLMTSTMTLADNITNSRGSSSDMSLSAQWAGQTRVSSVLSEDRVDTLHQTVCLDQEGWASLSHCQTWCDVLASQWWDYWPSLSFHRTTTYAVQQPELQTQYEHLLLSMYWPHKLICVKHIHTHTIENWTKHNY